MTPFLPVLFAAALANTLLIPLFIRLSHKHGMMDHPGHRKIHETPVAKLGGLALVLSILAAVAVGAFLPANGPFGPLSQAKTLLILAFTASAALLGFVDDLREIRPRYKLVLQAALFGTFTVLGFRFETLHLPGMGVLDLGLLAYPLTLLWLLAVVNGFNFIDGIDGLASAVAAVCLFFLGVLSSLLPSHAQAFPLWAAGLGAILVFLAFNWRPARIYLGDSGSNALGAFIAMSLVAFGGGEPTLLSPPPHPAVEPFRFQFLTATLLVGYPFLEITLSFVRRAVKRLAFGRSMEFAEKEHIHHRLLKAGFPTPTICLMAAGFQVIVATAGLLAMKDQNAFASFLLVPLAMALAYWFPRWDLFDYLGTHAKLSQPHFKIANYYNLIQRTKLGLAQGREEVLALVVQTCREFGVRCFRIRVPRDKSGQGGMDYICPDIASAPPRPARPKEPVFPHDHEGEFYDFCELPGQTGEAFWIFSQHTSEDELDIEYRVLVRDFMRGALETCIRLGGDQGNLEIPSTAMLPHHKTSGHALRRTHKPRGTR